MRNVRITREFDFAMAHCLPHHEGKCRFIHGHNYKMFVTVGVINEAFYHITEDKPDHGMIMDFSALNKMVKENIVDVYDHSLMLWDKTISDNPKIASFINSLTEEEKKDWNIHIVDYRPTAENMCVKFYDILGPILDKYFYSTMIAINACNRIYNYHIKLYENDKSFAEYGDF